MNKNFKFIFLLAAVAVLSSPQAFARTKSAEVLGKVYQCEKKLPYVPVQVTCGGKTLNGQTGSTGGDLGKYSVTFRDGCHKGDTAQVTAFVDGKSYSASGTIGTYFFFTDKAWIDVQTGKDCGEDPSVPEFGAVTGVLAGLGSVGSYLLLKKRAAKF